MNVLLAGGAGYIGSHTCVRVRPGGGRENLQRERY